MRTKDLKNLQKVLKKYIKDLNLNNYSKYFSFIKNDDKEYPYSLFYVSNYIIFSVKINDLYIGKYKFEIDSSYSIDDFKKVDNVEYPDYNSILNKFNNNNELIELRITSNVYSNIFYDLYSLILFKEFNKTLPFSNSIREIVNFLTSSSYYNKVYVNLKDNVIKMEFIKMYFIIPLSDIKYEYIVNKLV